MKIFIRKTIQELTFLLLLILGGFAIAKAQDQQSTNSKKVKLEVEVTENGSKSTTITEKQMDQDGVDRELDEMIEEIEIILDEAVNDLDETDLEIIIRRNGNVEEPRFRKHMMAVPDAPLVWNEESEPRAFLGVVATKIEVEEAKDLDLEKGARINKVVKGSAAEKAGLKEGDIITVLDGNEVSDFSDVAEAIRVNEPGDNVKIEILRDGNKKTIDAELVRQQSRSYAYSFDWTSDEPNVRPPHHVFSVPHFESMMDVHARKAFLGIVGKSVEDEGGVRLEEVFEGSTANEMGLKEGRYYSFN